ncbi:hypothetical protein FHL15_003535 [Xylaria flabelliformis]|uniref:Clr5 domain-containing protein n=1 Tax=Xylaria flabelliformis TaxID=2512241 RepID=A0A553I5U7_9PEZI|nr:hypothetical protein FHL15_003535 [Xylaria flabelliformis]
MTKPWDLHEATIKKLTRAYRGRLDKWGVRKYNCRRRSDCGSISAGSPEGSISGSDTASPTLSQSSIGRSHDPAPYPTGRHTRITQSGMSSMQGRSYSNMEMDTHRTDSEQYAINLNLSKGMGAKFSSYSRNRTLASPTHDVQYGWNIPQTQSTSPPTMFSHPNIIGTSGPLYAYPPVSPTSNTYPSGPYEPDQAAHDRRQSYPLVSTRQYSTMHNAQTYPPVRDYGHGHSTAGMRSFNSIRERIDERNPRG